MQTYPYVWNYLPLVLQILVALGLACGMVGVSFLIGKHKNSRTKASTYESGMDPIGDARGRFSVRFYLVAMLFILFDLEIVFMYPWAVVYKEMIVESKLILWSMLSFITILMAGYVYALKKGALDWKK